MSSFSWYLIIMVSLIFTLKSFASYLIKENKDDDEYIEASKLMGENTVFVVMWFFLCVLWPISLSAMAFTIVSELFKKGR